MILVTGGTGLLGSHLLFRLSAEDKPLRALFRDKSRIDRVKDLFNFYDPEKGTERFSSIEWVEGDILDIVSLEDAMLGIRQVYHCAGFVSFAEKHFQKLIKINREGTANVVNVCLTNGIDKLCFVSSTSALGSESRESVTENVKWKQSPDTSGYSISKYSAEKEVWRGVEEGLDAIIVNPSVIFGPGSWDETSLTIFRTVENGLRFYTSGGNAFVDARDVSDVMVGLMNSDLKNERYLCTGTNCSYRDITTLIAEQLGKNPPSISTPRWLMGLAWRISWITAKLRGNDPVVTKASARTAYRSTTYDPSKVLRALNMEFRPLKETVANTIKGKLD